MSEASGRPPSVDALARSLAPTGLPHAVLVDIARRSIAAGEPDSADAQASRAAAGLLRPVVNATGVLLHTNLGRAPMAVDHPASYQNIEYDLAAGGRGDRSAHAAGLLARAAGAEAALIVNNGAAAVLLALSALAAGRDVVVSRGELVEIGGGFRIPEVLAASGARLVEVGTTNRTRRQDYEQATTDQTAAYLKVHASNYRITGFTENVAVSSLAAGSPVPVIVDLGSGLLDAGCPWLPAGPPAWLHDEPAVRQTLDGGAALVTFSGDKLLGGPQAGIIAGSAELVRRCQRHPLARALRPGGLVLAALQDTALTYLRRQPNLFWRLATTPVEDLEARIRALGAEPAGTASVTGGGTLPGVEIPSAGIILQGDHAAALRSHDPPVIARVAAGSTVVDLRTVLPEQDEIVGAALKSL